MAPELSQTLDRGLRVLTLVARADPNRGVTMTQIADELGVGRTIAYRLVATLEAHALVVRRPDGRVTLGLGVARFAGALGPLVRDVATPVLRRLADELGATTHLTLVEGSEAVAVVVVEPSWTDYHVAYRTGSRHPIGRGAAGLAILAGREGSLDPVGTHGELQPGAHGVAAALPPGAVEGSVGAVALHELPVDEVGPSVARAAQAIADALRLPEA
ncbi:transcriptional regulator [Knoellia remsis]|uniref:Transcriptional regulator n=1 Tax=Knoellia remsis TaxID=407159 RepID=A0A2T0UZ40_9MICO|nr:helix-turn-helix domain-containing protein [Knoellia remsis]PRY63189.1 transcriptional regulator [Knoellia remsis]